MAEPDNRVLGNKIPIADHNEGDFNVHVGREDILMGTKGK